MSSVTKKKVLRESGESGAKTREPAQARNVRGVPGNNGRKGKGTGEVTSAPGVNREGTSGAPRDS